MHFFLGDFIFCCFFLLVPAFKGRPRKRKNIQKPVTLTTTTTNAAKKIKINAEPLQAAVVKKDEKMNEIEEDDTDDEDNLKLSTLAKKKNLLNNNTTTVKNDKDKNSIDPANKERIPYQPLLLGTLYQYQTTASAGRGVRGRDTICYEKRESTIKVNYFRNLQSLYLPLFLL